MGKREAIKRARRKRFVYERSASYRWRGWRTRARVEPVTIYFDPNTPATDHPVTGESARRRRVQRGSGPNGEQAQD